ncbi:fructose-1,6-bisphosphatase/inositol monophosphatase family enzyme [Actinoplanes octamycinicus]|uniref:Fructose-1,6-bisphosphatase/inositol monophosphatase family enzyme n=1 Tax=Actinoplanes octamycinicus TaxID=135948 RepID=A0A7W7GUX9_9ACTN|nr:inositol monophosphatase family protein [Actinoplanes octamycinicus]MBB4738746.1 fructose-1,6-bisphosphatase/inositol monophosphatase family enzyme [Actinoplanes octamycinicus]GIE61480.1 inositol monophosphatase [Actinoplanes octamycinicus]
MLDRVSDLIREVAQTVVLPRFQRLAADEVHQKSPGDMVTIADQESERALTRGLTALLPGSVVVGEEAVAADPSVRDRIGAGGAVWIVDPVDGTNNFAAGLTPFCVMVALVRDGVTTASWILDVVEDRLTLAEAGSGAFRDGVRLKTRADAPVAGDLHGVISRKYFPDDFRDQVDAHADQLGGYTNGRHCAGYEYPAIATDRQQFAMFWRILPWDHAPGTLIVRESGGVARHLDGAEYLPTNQRRGLLVAANEEIWQTVHGTLFPDGSPTIED